MANFQDMAAYPDRVLIPVVINEYISYPDSLAKNTAAFFIFPFPASTSGFPHGVDSIPVILPTDAHYPEKHFAVL